MFGTCCCQEAFPSDVCLHFQCDEDQCHNDMFPQVIKTFYILAVIGHSCRCVWQLSHTHWGWHRVRESYRWSFSGLVRGLRGQKTLKHPISPFETFPLVLLLLHLSAQNTPESEVLQSRLLQWAHTWNIQGGTNPDSPFGSRGTNFRATLPFCYKFYW